MLDQFLPYSPDEYLAMPLRPDDLGDIPALMEVRRAAARGRCARRGPYTLGHAADARVPAALQDDRCRATKHTVRVTDTDMNAHINNVIYVSWVVSTTPPAAMNGRRLQQLDIEVSRGLQPTAHGARWLDCSVALRVAFTQYKRECRMGEGEVLCLCRPADDGTGSYIYSLQETASNRGPASEFARARCVFADN